MQKPPGYSHVVEVTGPGRKLLEQSLAITPGANGKHGNAATARI
jgi:hypothetical protein